GSGSLAGAADSSSYRLSSSSVVTTHWSRGPACRTSSRYVGCTTAATHWALSTKYPTSAATERAFVVTPTDSSPAQANRASTASGQLSAWMSSLSPLLKPRTASPAASRRTSARNSA